MIDFPPFNGVNAVFSFSALISTEKFRAPRKQIQVRNTNNHRIVNYELMIFIMYITRHDLVDSDMHIYTFE